MVVAEGNMESGRVVCVFIYWCVLGLLVDPRQDARALAIGCRTMLRFIVVFARTQRED